MAGTDYPAATGYHHAGMEDGRAGWIEKVRNISPVFEKKESRLFDLMLQLHGNKGTRSKIFDIINAEINNGTVKLDINTEKQNRHIKGTKEYIKGRLYYCSN